MGSSHRLRLPLENSAAKPSPIGVEGVMGYATAPCEIFDSTQTTAPEPSTVARVPGKRGAGFLARLTISNVEAFTFPPIFFGSRGREQVIAPLFGLHVRDHGTRELLAFILHPLDGFAGIICRAEVEQIGGEALELAADAIVLALHLAGEGGIVAAQRRQDGALFIRKVPQHGLEQMRGDAAGFARACEIGI